MKQLIAAASAVLAVSMMTWGQKAQLDTEKATTTYETYGAYVCQPNTILFSSTTSAETIGYLQPGEDITVLAKETRQVRVRNTLEVQTMAPQVKVRTTSGTEGWVMEDRVCKGNSPLKMQPVAELPEPEKYAVAFLPILTGDPSFAFLVAPDGKIGTIPMSRLGEATKAGYRPFNVADLLAITNAVAQEEKDLQRRITELSDDYSALVARYNRLAAINAVAVVAPLPTINERQIMRAMAFQSLLQQMSPERIQVQGTVQVQTMDCTKFPALCVR